MVDETVKKRTREKPDLRFEMLQERLLFGMFFALCSEIKERIKKTKDENNAEVMAKSQKKSVNLPKVAAPKGPKAGGGGAKGQALNTSSMR